MGAAPLRQGSLRPGRALQGGSCQEPRRDGLAAPRGAGSGGWNLSLVCDGRPTRDARAFAPLPRHQALSPYERPTPRGRSPRPAPLTRTQGPGLGRTDAAAPEAGCPGDSASGPGEVTAHRPPPAAGRVPKGDPTAHAPVPDPASRASLRVRGVRGVVRDGRRPGSRASARPGQRDRPGLTSDTKSVRRRGPRSPGAPANRRLASAGHAPRALARKVEPAGPGEPACWLLIGWGERWPEPDGGAVLALGVAARSRRYCKGLRTSEDS